jgi:hypothetical protein
MKPTFTLNNCRRYFFILILSVSVGAFMSCSVVQNVPSADYKKGSMSHKERNVKIYPDMLKRIMHVKSIEEASLDFFVFDLQGTLVRHYKMQEGDHKKIGGLDRGAYVYQVFKNDEMSESGKLNIK